MNSMEQYFEKAIVPPEAASGAERLSLSERAFLEKYVGVDWLETQGTRQALLAEARPERVLVVAEPPAPAGVGVQLEAELMAAEELRLVSFNVGDQVFAVPIMMVQEVLRAVPVTELPGAPDFLAGVVNLRGSVTPLVDLATLLGVGLAEGETAGFLVVCRMDDFQIGLQVRTINTMHTASRRDIEWSVESKVGVYPEFLLGLLKEEDRLIKILSVSLLFKKVLKS